MVDVTKLTESIKIHEGTGPLHASRFMPYRDSRGLLTIGYGRCIEMIGVSLEEANFLLSNDIAVSLAQAQAQSWYQIVSQNDPRCRAIVEIIFNLGLAKFEQFINAIAALNKGDWENSANEFENSAWFREVGQRGEELVEMIRSGEDLIST